ncbi:TonB-dependent receptor plug domain-containing protein [Actomonas aquatica]|uniref:TonB-dependent receptor n=1 Tax=Actomonas aquatica TaxID=2866162 RepID=A0ABZ1CE91_9BACT|nr:TonB-dependent receptor [Opitutus sp. WL0086]WRQ89869.1 TonB-dependent receptor [Opitutus sp. WL0086]
MLPFQRYPALAGLAALSALSGLAQTPPPSAGANSIMLDPFPVVGSRLSTPTDEVPSPDVIVLDDTFITRAGATDLAQLVGMLPQTYGGSASGTGTVPNGAPSYGTARGFYNFTTGAAVPLSQTGVSSVGLGAFGAGGTLVLIDGRRLPLATQGDNAGETQSGFYDLSAIPLGLVERVEILTNGASAVHGSDAVGGVVNVILRRNYHGGELTTGIRGTFDGGAFERHATLSTGFVRDRLSVFLSLTARDQQALRGSQRAFSASQNLTGLGGRDHRLIVGSPGVLTARSGTLNGLTDADGNPARHALVPTGQTGTGLTVADFEGSSNYFASRLRYYDSAADKDLVGATEQLGLRGSVTYAFNDNLEAFATLNGSDRRAETTHEPPAVSGGGFGGAQTIVPAASPLNPFGQDLYFTGVLTDLPPRPQTVDVTLTTATAGLRGVAADTWQWEVAAHLAHERFDSRTLELDTAAFIAALADGSYNVFADPATTAPLDPEFQASLMQTARIHGSSETTGANAFIRGPAFTLPAGDILLAAGAETARAERDRASTNPNFGQPAAITSARTTSAAFAELYLPLFSAAQNLPALHRLSLRAAARYERADAFSATTPSLRLQWQPLPDLTVFAHYAEGFRAPALSEIEDEIYDGTSTVTDPRNGGASTSITRLRGGNPDLDAETSRTYQTGLILAPRFVSVLQLHAHLSETYWSNRINSLPEQTLVNHEDRFPDRIFRDATGTITTVDATTLNFGKIYSRAVDAGLSYRWENDTVGRFTFNASAVRQLEYRVENRPDRPGNVTLDGADTISPPKWSGLAHLFWDRGPWDAAVFVRHMDGYASNRTGPFFDRSTATPSWTTVDLRLGYTFREGLWHGYGRNARLQLGIGNLADRQPPFANTPYGYNQSLYSPLGRTYDVTLRLPF